MEEGGRDVDSKDQFYQQIQLVVEPLKDWLIHAEGGNMKIVINFRISGKYCPYIITMAREA